MFADILSLIAAPATTLASMTGAWSDLRQATAAEEVRLDAGKSPRLPPRRSRPAAFDRCCRRDVRLTVVETPQKGDRWQPTARNLGNVGWNALANDTVSSCSGKAAFS
jgi:hypothetical protein